MAQLNFNNIQLSDNNNTQLSNVSFFSLKNDNDEAIVRFAHDSVDSFELLTTHDISYNGKFRKINCIRTPKEPLENCPLCASGKDVKPQTVEFYIGQPIIVNKELNIVLEKIKKGNIMKKNLKLIILLSGTCIFSIIISSKSRNSFEVRVVFSAY